jgi:archaellum component FlaC
VAETDLVVEILKRIQADTSETRRRMEKLELRMSSMDDHLRGVMTSLHGVHSDLGQLNGRVERIERRLDLVEA